MIKAKHYFIYLARQVDKEPDSADGLILRDIGRFYRDSQQVQSAHHYYQQAMLKEGYHAYTAKNNIEYTTPYAQQPK